MIPIEKRDLVLIAPTEQRGLALPICIERKYLVSTITIENQDLVLTDPINKCTIKKLVLLIPIEQRSSFAYSHSHKVE